MLQFMKFSRFLQENCTLSPTSIKNNKQMVYLIFSTVTKYSCVQKYSSVSYLTQNSFKFPIKISKILATVNYWFKCLIVTGFYKKM